MTDDPSLLTQKDITIFNPFFPEFELPLHMGLHCDININGKVTNSAILAVSPHLISAFKSKGSQKVTLIKTFYITDIKHLYHLTDSVRVKFEKDNLQVEISDSKTSALLFTQVLYRNYTLFYYKLGEKYELEVSTKEAEKFPEIKLDISPSQRFQFYFSAQCAKCQVNYRHEVCRYMHNLITTNNPVFDFSQIPINAITGTNSILLPLIKSIQITKFIRGICWENFSYPDLLNQLSPLFGNEENSEGLRMIHLVNCDLCGDFSQIIQCIDNSSERRACFISYWNLKNNPKLNFENFCHLIDLTLSKIEFLSISNCNINEKVAKEIFLALSKNPNSLEIRHLEIGGVSMTGKSITAFEKFLKLLNSRNTNKINLLDISSCDNLNSVLELINKELPDLEILNVSDNKFSSDDFLLLTNYISHSKKLKEIDLSRTKFSSEKVADVIKTFSKNDNLQNVTLKLNDLKLNSENLLPLFRVFLSQKESCDKKWKSFQFDSNGINCEDLLCLTSLFKKFPNLETLSFSHNFDQDNEENKNIGDALVKLLSIPSLKNLSIVGDSEHRLGQELIQFLQAKNNNLEKIDISENRFSDTGFAEAIKLIKRSEKLKCISLRNNGMKNKNILNDLLSALKNSKNCPTVIFPLFDSPKKTDKNNKNEQSSESLIEDQKQVEISEIFMKNRRKEGQVVDLPFDYGDDYTNEFVNELSTEFEKNFENEKRFTHSCICMKIHLPLPFQRTTETTTGMRKEVEIGKMSVYQTDSMNYVVTEQCPQGVKPDKVEEVKNKEIKKKKNQNKDEKIKKNKNKSSDDESISKEENIKKNKKTNKNKNSDSDEDSDQNDLRNKKKRNEKKRKKISDDDDDDESDEEEERRKKRETKKKKQKKISSDESESEDKIDTRNIEYNLQTAIPKNSKRKQTDKYGKRQKNESESDSEPRNRKRYNQRKKRDDSESESYDDRYHKHNKREDDTDEYEQPANFQRKKKNKYDDEIENPRRKRNKYDDEIDDDYEEQMMNHRRRKKNKYDDEIDDYERPTMNAQRRKNKYDDEMDDDDIIINQRNRKKNRYDDDYEEDDDDIYNPNAKRRKPAPRFNNNDDRSDRNRAHLKDQTVKRRIKESNPQLDGTFPDPYYKRKNVPITKV